MVAEITKQDELMNLIATSEKLIVVDFYAQWCGPCKTMSPFLEELETGFGNVHFVKVDIEAVPKLTQKFQVSSMPTFVFIKQGEIKTTIVGADIAGVYEAVQKYH